MVAMNRIEPILERIPADRQGAKRHYGMHPYFTRRPANVVRTYIKHFTQPGEYVLDPFGGSGVTAIEAMLLNRQGIHNDINPLANFITAQVAETSHQDTNHIKQALLEVQSACMVELKRLPTWPEEEVQSKLKTVKLPQNIGLPSSSDVATYFELFSPRQLLALAVLKQSIDRISDARARGALLLAWSSTLGKLNRTFLSAQGRAESRGGSSIFSIYRYKVAERPVELPAWETFHERVMNVIKGKEEVLKQKRLLERTHGWVGGFEHHCVDIEDLPAAVGHKVDYIFTDPPYGGHIAYLDLSILWNHWLGFEVPLSARQREIIVGGELHHSEDSYIQRLRESITICIGMLKQGRWLSVVFQHWNTRYFEAILEEAAHSRASLKAAVTQIGDTIWSMHKKKNREKVLAGEMILTFVKDGKGKLPPRRVSATPTIEELIDDVLAEVTPDGTPFPGELLFNHVVLQAWSRGALHSLDLTRDSFAEILRNKGWQYNRIRNQWFSKIEGVPSDYHLAF
jgi:16S rRNA G966 N2-methylase RsmD